MRNTLCTQFSIVAGVILALVGLTFPDAWADSPVPEGQMQAYCQGEASAYFGTRPTNLSTNPVQRRGNEYVVQGQISPDGGRDATNFECLFGKRGMFKSVTATGTTYNQGGYNQGGYNQGGYNQAGEYQDLNGESARNFDTVLEQRGFTNVDSFKSGTAAYTIWYKADSNQCVQATVTDGRVYDIRDIGQHPKCTSYGTDYGSDGGTWYSRLVGAAYDGAESQLNINGFYKVDSFDSGRNSFGTIWYNGSQRQCLQVITVNGRVDSAVDIHSHPSCN